MSTEETFFLSLKKHRESSGIELEEISEFTKIHPRYLKAIEEGDFTVLPNVYMRLFLRSYALYIEADENQALVDYELYTTGKIQPKLSLDDSNKQNISNNDSQLFSKEIPSLSLGEDFQINYKQIITIGFTGLIIFLSFMLVSYISKDEKVPEVIDERSAPSESIDKKDTLINSSYNNVFNNNSLLSNLEFKSDYMYDQLTEIIPVNSPAKLTFRTLEETKLHIVTQQKNGSIFFLII